MIRRLDLPKKKRQRQWQIHLENNPRDLWPLRHLIRMMRGHELTNNNTVTKTIPQTCDIWDTNYNSDNWEPEFMTICVAWQLRVTLDSIRTSCDVYGIWGRLNGWQKRYLVNKPKVKKSRFGEFFDYWAFGLPQTKWFKNQSRVLIIQINCFCEKYKKLLKL